MKLTNDCFEDYFFWVSRNCKWFTTVGDRPS